MNKSAQKLGKLGGQATLKKHGKEQMKEWGKLGGRPKKVEEEPLDKCPECGHTPDTGACYYCKMD